MKKENQPLSFASIALALANDYSRLFVIDSDDDSYIEYLIDGAEKELIPVSSEDNFFEAVPRDAKEQVWPEDQAYFLSAFQKETMMTALENGRSFSLTYRLNLNGNPHYFSLKAIRASDHNIIIGVQDVDARKRKELESEDANRTYTEIVKSLASQYVAIYHVDLTTGHYMEYSSNDRYSRLGFFRPGEDFFEVSKSNIRKVIHPDDKERVLHAIERDVLLNSIRTSGSFTITYRQMFDGQPQYMALLAFRQEDNDERLVVGVRNIDEQKRQEEASATYQQIAGALASRYEVIYHINIDTNEYTMYSSSNQYAKLGTTKQGKDFFNDAASDIRVYIHPDDVTVTLKRIDKEHLLNTLQQNGMTSFTYRQMLGGKYLYMNMQVVQPRNDSHHIVIGVSNTDAQVRREQSLRAQNRTFNDISLALAQQYEVIYHVNIRTNEYAEYSASEKYSKLKVGTRGKDFFAETQTNMKRDIYPEDLPMMVMAMQKENLLKNLFAYGKTFLNYRLMIDGRPQYVSLYAILPKEDSDHIIVSVANIDASKRMEEAYHDALDMANKDAMTGVKNKRAYAQAEAEIDEAIKNGGQEAFAVVVCDLNGLKQVNDTLGHSAGDEFIHNTCAIICEVFCHSPVFRIGGDEFAIILQERDYDHRDTLIRQLEAALDEHKHMGIRPFAFGISEFDRKTDMRVQDVFERADKLMYDDKNRCKAENQ
ncbi:MAG: GGDEF domain-containing protein [Clostridia bacterium]|nr:GGDEF domain-containing protein [Clostridia bacterium]